jgi:hypothetical protein
MYLSFILFNHYTLLTYSFHKLQSTCLLGAYSMIISDWSNVLYDIHEITQKPLVFHRSILLLINVIFALTSFANFIYCNVVTDIDSFTRSPIYIAMIIIQIVTELFLTTMMLTSGIQLLRRIHGVTGILRNITTTTNGTASTHCNSSPVRCVSDLCSSTMAMVTVIYSSFHHKNHTLPSHANTVNIPVPPILGSGGGGGVSCQSYSGNYSSGVSGSYRSEQDSIYSGFEAALNRLISVMATCAFCILVQVMTNPSLSSPSLRHPLSLSLPPSGLLSVDSPPLELCVGISKRSR